MRSLKINPNKFSINSNYVFVFRNKMFASWLWKWVLFDMDYFLGWKSQEPTKQLFNNLIVSCFRFCWLESQLTAFRVLKSFLTKKLCCKFSFCLINGLGAPVYMGEIIGDFLDIFRSPEYIFHLKDPMFSSRGCTLPAPILFKLLLDLIALRKNLILIPISSYGIAAKHKWCEIVKILKFH